MSRAVALKLQPNVATATVVRGSGTDISVDAAIRIPLLEGAGAKVHGEAIAQALASLKVGRAAAVVVVPRTGLFWQNYDLPPVPIDDLPDLVHMQAQRDLVLADDGEGFDFVPLAGDEEHPYRVIGLGVSPDQLKYFRDVCEVAELKLECVAPEPLGWAEVGRRIAAKDAPGPNSLHVFAVISERQAIVWASEGDALRAVRTIWLPEEATIDTDAAALASELRRTIMSLTHSHIGEAIEIRTIYCGTNAEDVASRLAKLLSRPVQAAPLEALLHLPAGNGVEPSRVELAPSAALAAALADRRAPLADFIHPRRRPAPPSRKRTYILAGVAAVALALMFAWQTYQNIRTPLAAAADAKAKQAALESTLEDLADDEAKADQIRAWLDDSINLLTEADYLAQQLRPEPLDSEKLKADEDFVLTKLVVANRKLTLSASVKAHNALRPVEGRLRAANYSVDRGPEEANSQAVPGYGTAVTAELERVDPSADPPEDPA